MWRMAGLAVLGAVMASQPILGSAGAAETEWVLREGVAIRGAGRMGRSAFRTDLIEAQIVTGRWKVPQAGDVLEVPGGTNRTWEAVTAREDGVFTQAAARGGYFYLPFVAEQDEVLLLRASGHSMVYVNGEPRAGDVYANGSVSLPVAVRRGTNDLLFAGGRGQLQVRLVRPERRIALDLRDPTLPDIVAGRPNKHLAAVLVVNGTTNVLRDLALRAASEAGAAVETPLPEIPPLTTRKVGFTLDHSGVATTNRATFDLTLVRRGVAEALDATTLTLRVRQPEETRRETFVSDLDGSVQYYAVVPARPLPGRKDPLALVLTVHGAGVEAQGQADAYAPKTWAHIVAATNRRPFGFDWEDWGRRDAMEVLEIAKTRYQTDPRQTYLTGHSMGGHGTWHLGVTFPDRFAALGPSAGWVSFFSYAGGRRYEGTNAMAALMQRAMTPSDTLALSSNYLHHGIYILHGDADDNVPVREARTMRTALEKFHRDFAWHEQPGAGHWWGNACVDWPPMFDWFARHQIPASESVRTVRFATANPGISASSHWVTIEQQSQALGLSAVEIEWNPDARKFEGRTTNVARLSLGLTHAAAGPAPAVALDGDSLTNLMVPPGAGRIWFSRVGGTWRQTERPDPAQKGPHRAGPFKEAFQHRMIFVYGTQGTPAENAWAYAKARFDAESFWYRGNGAVDVVADTAFDPRREPDRGVILYGHADSNAAWPALLGNSPLQIQRGGARLGDREMRGEDLAALFVRPRPGSPVASVGVVSGTGLTGLRLTDRVPYFMAGIAFPDVTVFTPATLERGTEGVRVAGFFGADWSVESGEFCWQAE